MVGGFAAVYAMPSLLNPDVGRPKPGEDESETERGGSVGGHDHGANQRGLWTRRCAPVYAWAANRSAEARVRRPARWGPRPPRPAEAAPRACRPGRRATQPPASAAARRHPARSAPQHALQQTAGLLCARSARTISFGGC
jgi:hypothetical protein